MCVLIDIVIDIANEPNETFTINWSTFADNILFDPLSVTLVIIEGE